MSDTITKFEDIEEAKSYSGLGLEAEYFQNSTYMTKNIDVKPTLSKDSKTIFREILDDFQYWNESWKHYLNNSDIVEKPINADELAENLAKKYEIEEL